VFFFLRFTILFLFIFFSFSTQAHVLHYNELKGIEFDIYRNGKNIGKHLFKFNKVDGKIEVKSEMNFEIKKLGIVLYKYELKGVEVYEENKLIKFYSQTNQNGKKKYVKLNVENDQYIIDGSSYKGTAPVKYSIGTWWNHSIIKAPAQISASSGRIIEQKVTFLGKERIKIGDKVYDTLHFNFSSTDKIKDKKKKLNTDVWYDEESLYWVKASFKKKGNWEYKLISVK